MSDFLKNKLSQWREKHLFRQRFSRHSPANVEIIVENKKYLSFSSNDYLGLANHPAVVAAFKQGAECYGVGSGASALLGGYTAAHAALEAELAAFFSYPRCLLFSSGFMANLGVVKALTSSNDLILIDKLAHASLIDAALTAEADYVRYKHNDVEDLSSKIPVDKSVFLITEGVFSMSGDIAPLDALINLKKEKNAILMVDDAHGVGVMGKRGCGVTENKKVDILVGTFGKAFGASGAFVLADNTMIETLIQFARPYIYTTAQPPAICEATRKSLQLIQEESWRRTHLQELILYFKTCAQQLGLTLLPSITPIQSILIGDEAKTMQYFAQLKEAGIWVAAVRPPTVPPKQSLLRISLTANHTRAQIDILLAAVVEATLAVACANC